MPMAIYVDEECEFCGSTEVTMFTKPEATATKECYTCEDCGREWTEWRDDGGLEG